MNCAKTELCIFDTALPQVVIDGSNFDELYQIHSIEGGSDIQFNIVASNTDYLDLNDTLLSISVKVKSEDSADLVNDADAFPSNNIFHTPFNDVCLTMNNEIIEGGNNSYATKAIIETIINYGKDIKDVTLASIGYHEKKEDGKKWIAKSTIFNMWFITTKSLRSTKVSNSWSICES